jgi:phage terminase large subunit GpA-like protein
MKRKAHRMQHGKPTEIIGVDAIKRTIYHHLVAPPGGVGYSHFPTGRSDEYYLQLTGERLVVVSHRGKRSERRWVPIHPAVEALDCRVYGYAALLLAEIDVQRAAPRIARQASAEDTDGATPPAVPAPPPAKRPPPLPRRKSGFTGAWRR